MFKGGEDVEGTPFPLRKPIKEGVPEIFRTLIATVYEYEHVKELLAKRKRDKGVERELEQVDTKELETLRELQKLVKRMKVEAGDSDR